jgi:hypothetical protein
MIRQYQSGTAGREEKRKMLCRSDMLKEIKEALEDASYEDISFIYYFLVGAGLIEEKGEEEHERKN